MQFELRRRDTVMKPPQPRVIARAAALFAAARSNRDALTPEAAAELAYEPGGSSKAVIAEKIRRQRVSAFSDSA